MSGRRPTPEQRAAIEAEQRDVLVEAGAGSGKTGVMVERYCRLVCEGGVEPDQILAFTFTDRAAAELRERIRAELGARAAAGSARAAALLPAFGGAWVTTIHGFCNRILAAHPIAVGLDPRFAVLDESEAGRAAAAAFDDALERFLADDGDGAREELLAAYELPRLRAMIRAAHAELRSRGAPRPTLPSQPPADLEGALGALAESAAAALAELGPEGAGREAPERALAALEGAGPPDLAALEALRPERRRKALEGYVEALEAAIARRAEAGVGGRAYADLGVLLELFAAAFEAEKARRGGVDFDDLQVLAVALLETAAGARYRGRFRHVMVDEFQDTNGLQLRLIEALRGPATALTAVGDELQSIYGFRHAEVEVFRRRRDAAAADPGAALLPLSGNFRSRPELIAAFNALGGALLGDAYVELRCGAPPPPGPPPGAGPPVELILTERHGWDEDGIDLEPATDAQTPTNQLAEARAVAARLRELHESGVPRGGMVVLLRAFTHLDAYEDSLERAGLRPYVVGGRGYWSQQQVGDVCALLATIANPEDDEALLGALASPACGVGPDTLWLLRAASGRGRTLWPAVERTAGDERAAVEDAARLDQIEPGERERLVRFAARIGSLRERLPLLGLAELIDAAVTETGYDLAILGRAAGEARFANVRKLMRLAAEFEAVEGRDLRGLLDFLAARAEGDADAQAATAVEGHDGVRIMTIHGAKGLEFPVVAVPQLARGLASAGRQPLLCLGREADSARAGLRLQRPGAPKIDLYAYADLCEEAVEREVAEELRLFHVAVTRARERLLLSGVVNPAPPRETRGRAIVERIVEALAIDRGGDSEVALAPPAPRSGLEASFGPATISVRHNPATAERARELRRLAPAANAGADGAGAAAPLLEPAPPPTPRLLSYSALAAARPGPAPAPVASGELDRAGLDPAAGRSRGTAVHALLRWSCLRGWAEPDAETAAAQAAAAGLALEPGAVDGLIAEPVRAWLRSALFRDEVRGAARCRSEVAFLVDVGGVPRGGDIDLLVERPGRPPLIVDFKTDQLLGESPAAAAEARYGIQRRLYSLAVATALEAASVEFAFVFLERPGEPVRAVADAAALAADRELLAAEFAAGEEAAALSLPGGR